MGVSSALAMPWARAWSNSQKILIQMAFGTKASGSLVELVEAVSAAPTLPRSKTLKRSAKVA
eukprot:3301854-Lingulodinium_polyedra.AAC.1